MVLADSCFSCDLAFDSCLIPLARPNKPMVPTAPTTLAEPARRSLRRHIGQPMDRQVMPTFSTHRVAVYRVELTAEEISSVDSTVRGVEDEGERTFPAVMTIRDIMWGNRVDWSALGMILSSIPKPLVSALE